MEQLTFVIRYLLAETINQNPSLADMDSSHVIIQECIELDGYIIRIRHKDTTHSKLFTNATMGTIGTSLEGAFRWADANCKAWVRSITNTSTTSSKQRTLVKLAI